MYKSKIINVPSKENPYLVIKKASNFPCAPINSSDSENALCEAIKKYPEILNVSGKKKIEYGLVHRIDTVTEGIFLIALTQDFYDYIQNEQKEGRFYKFYRANCDFYPENAKKIEGFPEFLENIDDSFTISSYFRNFGKKSMEVRPVTEASSKIIQKKIGKLKLYSTKIEILSKSQNNYEVKAVISEGFRHQVRCHLAWSGLPVKNDFLYNFNCRNSENLENVQFFAEGIEFINPNSKEKVVITE